MRIARKIHRKFNEQENHIYTHTERERSDEWEKIDEWMLYCNKVKALTSHVKSTGAHHLRFHPENVSIYISMKCEEFCSVHWVLISQCVVTMK